MAFILLRINELLDAYVKTALQGPLDTYVSKECCRRAAFVFPHFWLVGYMCQAVAYNVWRLLFDLIQNQRIGRHMCQQIARTYVNTLVTTCGFYFCDVSHNQRFAKWICQNRVNDMCFRFLLNSIAINNSPDTYVKTEITVRSSHFFPDSTI